MPQNQDLPGFVQKSIRLVDDICFYYKYTTTILKSSELNTLYKVLHVGFA